MISVWWLGGRAAHISRLSASLQTILASRRVDPMLAANVRPAGGRQFVVLFPKRLPEHRKRGGETWIAARLAA